MLSNDGKAILTRTYRTVEDGGKLYAVDENGEINHSLDVRPVISRTQADGYKEMKERMESEAYDRFGKSQRGQTESGKYSATYFVFLIYKPLSVFLAEYKSLSKSDYARLVYLATYLTWDDSRIKTGHQSYAKAPDIKRILMIPKRTSNDFLKRAKECGVIFEDEDGYIHLSPSVFKNGSAGRTSSTRAYARLYIKNTRELYRKFKDGKAVEKLSVLYSLIPYVDLRYNIICKNANEDVRDVSELEVMSFQEIADILGIKDVKNLKRVLFAIKVEIDGITYNIFRTDEDGSEKYDYVAVSPFFVYRDSPANWMTKITHLGFYLQLVRQLKRKGFPVDNLIDEVERRIAEM